LDRIAVFKTISVLSLALLICYLLFGARWLLWFACILILGNAFESRITTWIAKYWMKFAQYLGNINSKVLLSIIFFAVLTPVAFAYRRFNKGKVNHFMANTSKTYFDDIQKTYHKEDFERLW